MPFGGSEFYADDPILRVIDRVDALICDEEHWGQKDSATRPLQPMNGRWCPALAVHFGVGGNIAETSQAYRYIRRAVRQEKSIFVSAYNDAPERTFPEIKALIAKARELRLADIMETADAL